MRLLIGLWHDADLADHAFFVDLAGGAVGAGPFGDRPPPDAFLVRERDSRPIGRNRLRSSRVAGTVGSTNSMNFIGRLLLFKPPAWRRGIKPPQRLLRP